MKVITGDLGGDVKFLALLASIIIVPIVWVLLRKQDATDSEGRGKPPIELSDPATAKAGYPGIDYELIPPAREHPDLAWYREKLKRDAEELKKRAEHR